MAKKVYAVRRGRQTGIFNTWNDCKKQVENFPQARFKGFLDVNEAMRWLNAEESELPNFYSQTVKEKLANSTKKKSESWEQQEITGEADYVIYTDGSCLRNPDGPGGWAAVIMNQATGEKSELSDGNPSTTNNRMELTAAMKALEFADKGSIVDLYTDSQYLKNAFTKHWLVNWKKRGWKTATKADVKNKDLWVQLDALFQTHQVRFHWVKGHVGIAENERCDELAKQAAMRFARKA